MMQKARSFNIEKFLQVKILVYSIAMPLLGGCVLYQNSLENDTDLENSSVSQILGPMATTVKSGDTLYALAQHYDTDWRKIFKLNSALLKRNGLQVGQKLMVIPGPNFRPISALGDNPPVYASTQPSLAKKAVRVERQLNSEEHHSNEALEGDLPEGFPEAEFGGPHSTSDQDLISSSIDFAWPINGHVTSYFGKRGRKFHKGIDIRGAVGSPIRSASSGQILFTRRLRGYGKTVVVDHGDFLSLYAHCRDFNVQAGTLVAEGDLLAHVGMTGNSRGPHLHFEIRDSKKKAIDPFPLLSKKLAEFFRSNKKTEKLAQLMDSILKDPSKVLTI